MIIRKNAKYAEFTNNVVARLMYLFFPHIYIWYVRNEIRMSHKQNRLEKLDLINMSHVHAHRVVV